MNLLEERFVCIDCEATGLNLEEDRIIEVAAVIFSIKEGIVATFDSLVDPQRDIPAESTELHHITEEMVAGKPTIAQIIPQLFEFIEEYKIVGHSIKFDIDILEAENTRNQLNCSFKDKISIDTLRLARLYGKSQTNSLEALVTHFNIESKEAHRALNDVLATIEVFKRLISPFITTEQMIERLKQPIQLTFMPFGKYKAQEFKRIPLDYLNFLMQKDFDEDLMHTIESEIERRKKKQSFNKSTPLQNL